MTFRITVRRSNDGRSAAPLKEGLYVGGHFYIGSDRAAHLYLNGAGVAPRQAVLFESDGRTVLLSAAEGNELNGRPLPPQSERPLGDGDLLRFSGYLVSFASDGAPAAESPAGGALARAQPHNLRQHLASMNTEEEHNYKYYFLVRGGERDGERIILEASKGFTLGWEEGGQVVGVDPPPGGLRAVVEFTLTSVFVIRAAHPNMVAVNDRIIEEPWPLSDGDEVRLAPTPLTEPGNLTALVFHVPAMTDMFDSVRALKRREAEEAAAREARARAEAEAAAEASRLAPPARGAQEAQPAAPKIYLGYFTRRHLRLFAAVALVSAALTYLLLEFS